MVCVRYFIWLTVVFLFASGTAIVDLLSFVFLIFALVLISVGEGILIRRSVRKRFWNYVVWYTYAWYVIEVAYQIPAFILDISNREYVTDWQAKWRVLIGV